MTEQDVPPSQTQTRKAFLNLDSKRTTSKNTSIDNRIKSLSKKPGSANASPMNFRNK